MSYTETLPGVPGTWTAPDAWASEQETSEFLAGLVKLLKPKVVLETGCYHGDSSIWMAGALYFNGVGILFSCDTSADMVALADMNSRKVSRELNEVPFPAEFHVCTGEELCKNTDNVDLAFLDSSGDRVAEALALKLSPRGIVVLHDARRDTLQAIIEKIGWQSIFIDTPRGLAILQPKRQA